MVLNSGNIDYLQTQANGDDLRFIDNDGTFLAHEIEEWNESGDSYVWVKIPQIDGASNTDSITMYYGNAAAVDAQDSAAVWSDGFEAVYHLNDDFIDSTVNTNDGISSGSSSAAGQVADGQLFDGADDDVNLGSDASIDDIFAGGATVSAWINPSSWGENGYGRILDKSGATLPGTGWALELASGTQSLLFQQGFSGGVTSWQSATGSIQLDTWQHVSVTYDSSDPGNVPTFYINGIEVGKSIDGTTPTGTALSDAGLDLHVGNHAMDTVRTFAGSIDDVRLSSEVRSADWIRAQHLSTSNSFVTFGGVETAPAISGVLGNDIDADNDSLRVNTTPVSNVSNGTLILNADGTFTYTPDENFNGPDSFTYEVSDGNGVTDLATATITVNPINDAPVARPDGVYLSFDGDDFVRVADDLSLQMTNHVTMEAWINPEVGGTGSQLIINKEGEYELGIIADTGEIKFAIAEVGTPDHWDWHDTGYLVTSGEWTHVAVTYDGDANEAKTYINGELVDTFAQSGAIGDVYTGFNDLTIGGRGNDSDERFDGKIDEVRVWSTTRTEAEIQASMNDLLTATETGLAGNWRLDEATGTTAYDNSTNNNHGTLGGIVGAPEIPTYDGYYTNEDSLLVVPIASGLLANDYDIEGSPLTITNVDTTGMLGTLDLDTVKGSFTYEPRTAFDYLDAGERITETFTYTVNDGALDSNTATVSITVVGVEDAPVLNPVGNQTIDEGAELTFTATATDSDLPADTLTFSLADGTGAVPTGAAITAGGLFSWTPTEAQGPGTYTFDVVVSDGTITDSETITVMVTEVNAAPILGAIGNQTIAEGHRTCLYRHGHRHRPAGRYLDF